MKIQLPIITIFILSCFSHLKSQVPFWPVEARECIEQGCPDFSPILYFGIHNGSGKDTILQGKYCTLVMAGDFFPGPLGGFPHFIYQDSARIFYYNPTDSSFQLLYDFDLEEGDFYRVKINPDFYYTDSVTVFINQKTESMINGFKVRRQSVTVVADSAMWEIHTGVCEGVGGISGNVLLLFNPNIWTHCYTKTLWYETPETGIIPVQPPSDLSGGCPITSTDTEEPDIWLFETYPNPSNGYTTIRHDLPPNFSDAEVRYFDSTGRLCAVYPIKHQKGEISMENLAAGFHLFTLLVEGEVKESKKILVFK